MLQDIFRLIQEQLRPENVLKTVTDFVKDHPEETMNAAMGCVNEAKKWLEEQKNKKQ